MKSHSLQLDVTALGIVVQALERLDDQQRLWVLQTAASRFWLIVETAVRGGNISSGATGTRTEFSVGGDDSPKGFIRTKSPQTDVQRITCLAYYLTKLRSIPHFKTKELTDLNREAACPKLSNPTVAVNNARKAQYLTPAGKGNKQLTTLGEDLVDALPDQEKVRSLASQNRPRKRKTRKKK